MAKFTFHENVKIVHAISAASHTAASTTSNAIDCLGYTEALVLANIGIPAANAELNVSVLESDSTTTASFAAITGATMTESTPTANSTQTGYGRLNVTLRKRYLQVKFACDGSNAVLASADVLLTGAKNLPVVQATSNTAEEFDI